MMCGSLNKTRNCAFYLLLANRVQEIKNNLVAIMPDGEERTLRLEALIKVVEGEGN